MQKKKKERENSEGTFYELIGQCSAIEWSKSREDAQANRSPDADSDGSPARERWVDPWGTLFDGILGSLN